MHKRPFIWTRICIVATVSLVACYTGVRTAADVSVTFTFKGQIANSLAVGTDSDGNTTIAEVTCIVGDDGNSKPTPIRKAWLDDEVDGVDTAHYASTLDYNDFTGSYSPFNGALNGTATCDATTNGTEALFDFNTWETTDLGPVTMHGTTTTGNPTEVVSGVNTTIVKDRATGNMSRFRSRGKTGLNPSGTLSVSVTGGGSGTPPPALSGPITSDWSSVQIVNQSQFSKIHH